MAAIYQYAGGGRELFRGGTQVLTSVEFDFLQGLLPPASRIMVTSLTVQTQDVVQYFLSFDDLISWFYFGAGLGTMQVGGIVLSCGDAAGGTGGLSRLLGELMRRMRGRAVTVSVGNAAFFGVLNGLNLSLVQDPAPVVEFTLALTMTGHTLPSNRPTELGCLYNPAAASRRPTTPVAP